MASGFMRCGPTIFIYCVRHLIYEYVMLKQLTPTIRGCDTTLLYVHVGCWALLSCKVSKHANIRLIDTFACVCITVNIKQRVHNSHFHQNFSTAQSCRCTLFDKRHTAITSLSSTRFVSDRVAVSVQFDRSQ